MIRRLLAFVVALAGASVALAQMPPSIKKPIEQARKNVNATNAQTAAVNAGAKSAPATAQKAALAPAKAPAKPQSAAASPVKTPTGARALASAASSAPDSNKITFEREVFTYVPREIDPFASPIESGAIRPLVADLKVVGIIYDPAGRNSVAVMRDISTMQQYRAKPGQMLGRARVTQIRPQEVVLAIEEYGFSRQETLKLNVQQTQQTKGKP